MSRVIDAARLRVLRATVAICLLISLGNLAGAFAGFTPSGDVAGPARPLGVAWCVLWALAAVFPAMTARCFTRWEATVPALAALNLATGALTGGIDSPLLAVCMYVGWIASVVLTSRAALTAAAVMSGSVLAGYFVAGDSIADVFTGPYRYDAVANASLPMMTGIVGVLIAHVTNSVLGGLGATLDGLRRGLPATTPALTALFSGRLLLEPPAPRRRRATAGAALTRAELEVVRLLADGYAPKQVARMRGVEPSTVRAQLKRSKAKTGARTLAELARHVDP